MANEIRALYNFISGTITNNPLLAGGTTLNSAALANLPAVGATEHVVIVLNPLGDTAYSTGPEIVYVTAHTAAATSATISRGKEGTTGIQHATGTPWVHGPVASDYQIPWEKVTRTAVAGSRSTSSVSYSDWNGTESCSVSITKILADTTLVCQVDAAASQSAGFTTTFGVQINGTDYDVSSLTRSGTGDVRTYSGATSVTGVPAGSYTVKLRWKSSGTSNVASGDYASLVVREAWTKA